MSSLQLVHNINKLTTIERLVARKSRRTTSLPATFRWLSQASRPYKFHVGASWAGKPLDYDPRQFQVPFAPESVIGTWRDKTLSRPKAVNSKDAGEDFFYVQEVSKFKYSNFFLVLTRMSYQRCEMGRCVSIFYTRISYA